MPIYEYRCQSCGHLHEALQKVSDPHLTDCPECDDGALKRLMSAPSFRLKGSGWYETDFKFDKERKRNLVEGSEKAADSAKDASASSGKNGKEAGKSDAGKSSDSGSKASESKPSTKSSSKGSGSGTEAA